MSFIWICAIFIGLSGVNAPETQSPNVEKHIGCAEAKRNDKYFTHRETVDELQWPTQRKTNDDWPVNVSPELKLYISD